MKLGAILVVGVASLALTATATAATQPAPEPSSPINGQAVQVDPTNGISLLIRATSTNPVSVEAWKAGGTALTTIAKATTDVTVDEAKIGPTYFTPTAPDSLYSGQTGTVYWRPRSECADEITFKVSPCEGETQSFVYSLGMPAPPTSGPASARCREARASLKVAERRREAAKRRTEGGHTPAQNLRHLRKLRQRTAAYERAKREVQRAC